MFLIPFWYTPKTVQIRLTVGTVRVMLLGIGHVQCMVKMKRIIVKMRLSEMEIWYNARKIRAIIHTD